MTKSTVLLLGLLRKVGVDDGSYFPDFWEPLRRSEQALVAVIQDAYVAYMSTWKEDPSVQALGMTGISQSTVSGLC